MNQNSQIGIDQTMTIKHQSNIDQKQTKVDQKSVKTRAKMTHFFTDKLSIPRGGRHPSTLPNPRWISQKNHPDSDNPDYRFTHMVMQFGQFLDHDITFTPKDGKSILGLF